MFGSFQTIQAFYWLQAFYCKFWMVNPKSYMSDRYALFALAESVSITILMTVNSISTILWCLTGSNFQWLILWYVNWVALTHYIDCIRFAWLILIRSLGMMVDHSTSYHSYSGLNRTQKVSKEHDLDFWDFMMVFGALGVGFGFYPDLQSIKYIKPKKGGKKKKAIAALIRNVGVEF